MDWIVFSVTALIAIGFLVWGFVSTRSLAGVSGTALHWTMDNLGWLFVVTATGFVLFVLWLALSKFATSRWAATAKNRSFGPCPGSR